MTTFDFLKDSMKLSDQQMSGYQNDLELIEGYIKKNNITFGEHFKLGFYSHMIGFIDRLQSHEKLAPVDQSIKDDIDEKAYKITQGLLELINGKYDVEILECEVILASIHIQTALSMEA